MKPENKIGLKIDFRELRSGIIEAIEKLDHQLSVEVVTLPTGDYLINDQIIVERKTLLDFVTSIKNGRIFQQAYRMMQSDKNGLILIEGDKSMIDTCSISRKAVQGALIHLTVFIGIPFIRSLNIQETAALLIAISGQCRKQQLPRQKHILTKNAGFRLRMKQKTKLFLLQNLPGIGTKKGLALLQTFSSIDNITGASTSDLTKVRGIGKKLATNIYTTFHEPF